ncbi:MAG: hypothetical protein JW909_04640 [Planctomycetes bacterium]|nr:hypothetical protein [Planctomycetota bacterium]
MPKLTVHMIGNAHLDPVWLWNQPSGVDEALATCRTACDILDEYPEMVVTRGEAWVHQVVRQLSPATFERIKAHAATGRWAVVNGWWIQPDCNLPSAASFRKHAEISKAWFRKHLGVDVTVGYNVDSFGHTAALPALLRETGFDSYVFMRPGEHEKKLPAYLFEWQSPAGQSVTAFRITDPYTIHRVDQLQPAIEKTLGDANREIGHTMCFYGVGDHGGGPTREQVEWILEHRDFSGDVELKLSCPQAFFDAVRKSPVKLPAVRDELQYHAVGCYSVVHVAKQEMRRAETLCERAERLAENNPGDAPPDANKTIEAAWEKVLFNQFHDILAGSSIESAYEHARDDFGLAKSTARDVITHITRRHALKLPPCGHQRLVLANTGERDFSGLVHVEPWIHWTQKHLPLTLCERDGAPIITQETRPYAATPGMKGILVPVQISAASVKEIELRHEEPAKAPAGLKASSRSIYNGLLKATFGNSGPSSLACGGTELLAGPMRIAAFEDMSDTWSHDIPGFEGEQKGEFKGRARWNVIDSGALRAAAAADMTMGRSSLCWIVTADRDETILRMKIRLNWTGRHRIVKLVVPPAFKVEKRIDGIQESVLERRLNGWEYPVLDFVSVSGGSVGLAVVTRDAFSGDVQPDGTVRLTLLRCPPYAHHQPLKLAENHGFAYTDQGEHVYEISLVVMNGVNLDAVRDEIYRLSHPVVVTETTLGMRL